MKKFVFFRYDKVGDLIVSTPAFRVVKNDNPEHHITVVTSAYNRVAADGLDTVDEVLEFNPDWSLSQKMAFVRELRQRHFDYAVVLSPRTEAYYMADFCGARIKGGLLMSYRRLARVMAPFMLHFTEMIDRNKFTPFSAEDHHTASILRLMAKMGFGDGSPVRYDVPIKPAHDKLVSQHLARLLRPVIVVHLLESWLSDDWSFDHFDDLMKSLRRAQPTAQFILTAGPCEKTLFQNQATRYPVITGIENETLHVRKHAAPVQILKTESFPVLCSVMKHADVLVTPNTCMVHVAAAFNKPSIVLEHRGQFEQAFTEFAPWMTAHEAIERQSFDIVRDQIIEGLHTFLKTGSARLHKRKALKPRPHVTFKAEPLAEPLPAAKQSMTQQTRPQARTAATTTATATGNDDGLPVQTPAGTGNKTRKVA